MRLKPTQRLLNLASLVVVGAAGATGYWGMMPISNLDLDRSAGGAAAQEIKLPVSESGTAKAKALSVASATAGIGGTRLAMNWGRALRRPLFDPPPPAPIVVVKPPPQPIRAKLLATVIEPENSTAMIRLANGQVVFRKVGDSLGAEESSAEIAKIEAGSISVRRGQEELRLSVEGMKGN